MKKQETELKIRPCPHCGGEADTLDLTEQKYSNKPVWAVLCRNACPGAETTEAKAIERWNQRRDEDKINQRILHAELIIGLSKKLFHSRLARTPSESQALAFVVLPKMQNAIAAYDKAYGVKPPPSKKEQEQNESLQASDT